MLRRKSHELIVDEDLVHELDPSETVAGAKAAFQCEIDELADRSREILDQEFYRDPLAHWVLADRGARGEIEPLEPALCEFASGVPKCRSNDGVCPNCRGVNDEAADQRLRVLCVGNVLRKVHLPPGCIN